MPLRYTGTAKKKKKEMVKMKAWGRRLTSTSGPGVPPSPLPRDGSSDIVGGLVWGEESAWRDREGSRHWE